MTSTSTSNLVGTMENPLGAEVDMACQGEVIIIARPTYVCALCADMCRRPGKREAPNLETFLSVGKLGLAPASLSFPTRFLEGDSETEKQRNRYTITGNATHIIYIWAHLLLSSPMS